MSENAVPEGRYADIGDGLRVHYHEEGHGPAVVFLHGSGPGASGWSNFKGNYPTLARSGFRVIVPDTLGYGYSSKPDHVDYTLDFLVGGLERFLAAVGVDTCAVIGNSHGGAMAIALALRRPSMVRKLVLMAPGGLEDREAYMQMEGIRTMMKVFTGGITREGMRKIFELQLFDPSRVTEALLEEREQIAITQPKRVLTSMQVPNLAPKLATLTCPILALWGMNDKFCPVSGALTVARSCKRSRTLLLSECGHWVMVEHEALFNRQCADFLGEA